MDEQEKTDQIFNELNNYEMIIAYNDTKLIPPKFINTASSLNYMTLDLSVHPDFESAFRTHYAVSKLPCMLSKNIIIYDDENFEKRVEEACALLEIDAQNKIKKLVSGGQNIVFIKGTPTKPECKFTRQLVQVLQSVGLESGRDYTHFNIFEDERVRSTLKTVNKWPTFPQIYLNGEFRGGLDSLREMKESGELEKIISK